MKGETEVSWKQCPCHVIAFTKLITEN